MNDQPYGETFFDHTSSLSARSAMLIVPVVKALIEGIDSVVDFGCARGVWLKAWVENGVTDVAGVDGTYVATDRLLIDRSRFHAADLAEPIDLHRRFALVQSLEVAEHLPERAAATFVDTLTRHGHVILFSAAPPGQGGEHHVNEQPYEYWRNLFAQRGYAVYDCIRPSIIADTRIQWWYRHNTVLYVHESLTSILSPAVRATRIGTDRLIADLAPWPIKLRKAMIRRLPAGVENAIARGLARITARR